MGPLRHTAEKLRLVRTAWVGSMAALCVYLLLPWLVRLPETPVGEPYRGFRVILWSVAAVQVGVLFWWTRRSLHKEAVLREVEGTAIDPVTYYMARKIAAVGIAQSVAVYGLVLAFVGRYFWDQYVLTIMSAALLILHYPSGDKFDELAREIEKRTRR